jgi:hypothetical protein
LDCRDGKGEERERKEKERLSLENQCLCEMARKEKKSGLIKRKRSKFLPY